jgi:hypothetical protein
MGKRAGARAAANLTVFAIAAFALEPVRVVEGTEQV